MFSKTPVLFYCHFPDLLLANHKSWLQKMYRFPLDWIEEKSTGKADAILVNSNFTASIYRETFRSLKTTPFVLYPSLNFETFDQPIDPRGLETVIEDYNQDSFIFLSINRYERKKKIELAIQAFSLLQSKFNSSSSTVGNPAIHLIVAGGYDERVDENVDYFRELQSSSSKLNQHSITFLKSPSDSIKTMLLKNSHTLLYTPDKEHFGIVPLEAMYCGLPVIAINSGGPLETIKDHQTGYLCPQDAQEFAAKMQHLCLHRQEAKEMGQRGQQHVVSRFSFESFSNQMEKHNRLSSVHLYSVHPIQQ